MLKLRDRNMISIDDPHVSRIGLPAPPWLVNYADLMTELTILFIVLYAMSSALAKDIVKAKQDIQETLKEERIAGEVVIEKDGLRLSLEEGGSAALFESGSAELSDAMKQIMGKMHGVLYKLHQTHTIIVEGHTDNVPIKGGRYASNWELSTARATSVVRYLVAEQNFDPAKLAAIGYGEYRPIAGNDSPESRAKNRRVVFFVKLEGPAAEQPHKD
jgi:chemotaxis protein MotB